MKRFSILDFGFSIIGRAKARAAFVAICALLFALSHPVEAQEPKKIPRIGFLTLQSKPNASEEAFMQGLRDLGYIDGQTITIELRRAAEKGRASACACGGAGATETRTDRGESHASGAGH